MEKKELYIDLGNNIEMKKQQFQKMVFVMNALDNGWKVKKMDDRFIFTKKHENKKEVYSEKYLEHFIITNAKM